MDVGDADVEVLPAAGVDVHLEPEGVVGHIAGALPPSSPLTTGSAASPDPEHRRHVDANSSAHRHVVLPTRHYNVHMSEVVSVRFPAVVVHRLREVAAAGSESVSGLAQRLVDEGLRMANHPGIVFRSGPSGRRAALAAGPDIWEVVALIRSLDQRGDEAVREATRWLALSERQVRIALGYYGEFPQEVDGEIEANERAAERARRSLEAQQQLLS